MAVIQMSAYDKGRTNAKPAHMSCYCKDQRTLSESKEGVRAMNSFRQLAGPSYVLYVEVLIKHTRNLSRRSQHLSVMGPCDNLSFRACNILSSRRMNLALPEPGAAVPLKGGNEHC